jgi:hypothetical protein
MLDSPIVDCRHFGVHVQDCAESTTVSVDLIETDSSLDGLLGVGQRAELLEIADGCPVHGAVGSNVRIHTAAEVLRKISRAAGIRV